MKKNTKKKKVKKSIKRCWEYFLCRPDQYTSCLMGEIHDFKCWKINIVCCKINADAPHPLSIKKIICKSCAYYREYSQNE